ncbi:hypothetical protein LTR56_013469 [Elasticomyces elasticus]|nr:hypothetical protein LTR56_013469 [Elasticomyces elasticus]KAK5753929.1 hypothetical protein LTS12_016021 [Elasticomyces elasticus]
MGFKCLYSRSSDLETSLTLSPDMITFVFAAGTVLGAPFAQFGSPDKDHVDPRAGGNPGHFWNIHDHTINWPTHSINIVSNVTQDMPGWQPDWAPGSRFSNNIVTHSNLDPNNPTLEVGTGILGHVINQCSSTIYVHTAIGRNKDYTNNDALTDPRDGGTYPIAPGAWYTTTIRAAVNGAGGVSIKLSYEPVITSTNIYQVEYQQAANPNGNMAIWFDLSAENGSPFINEKRYMQVNWDGNACAGKNLYNAPQSNGADWNKDTLHSQQECENVGDVYFYLC